jgi:gliding motility-associated-like protein
MADGSATVTVTQGVSPYQYIWFNGDSAQTVTALAPGEYDLTIIDGNFCLNVFSIIVVEPDTLHAKATITEASCDGSSTGSVLLEGVGGTPPYEFAWEDFVGGALVENLAKGIYLVEISDSRGCNLDTSVYVGVDEGCLDLANIITPNGDGLNDVWVIQAVERFPNIVVRTFDRTGTLVFESNGYAEAWDATYNGKILPVGSYFYVIDLGDGTEELVGSVDIVY